MVKSEKSFFESMKEFFKTVFYALLIAGLIRTLFFQPFWIPSGSMKPNLLIGDYIFVNKFAYGYSKYSCPFTRETFTLCPFGNRLFYSEPKRGDVVVFRHPKNGKDYVKRLIGLPGDTIYLRGGQLWINDKIIERKKIDVFNEKKEKQGPLGNIPLCSNSPVALGSNCEKTQYLEKFSDQVTFKTLDFLDNSQGDNTIEFTVDKNEFFFLGDNRDNSMDSRFEQKQMGVGMVKYENLIGRADTILFSSAGERIWHFWSWRKDRFFKAVN